jgi:thioredoxin-like negative regulator of GroEL
MSITVYHFWSPTCNPCNVIKPAIEDIKEEFKNSVTWVSVNTHADVHDYTNKFGVKVVPTMVVAVADKEGKIVYSQKHSGTDMMSYYRIIRSAIKFGH